MQLFERLGKPFLILASLISLNACSTFQIADIGPIVTLPGSKNCFQKRVLTHVERIIPKDQCDEIKKRGIFLTSTDWQAQRLSIQKNCQAAQCKQLVGAFDNLFKLIDDGLKKVPLK